MHEWTVISGWSSHGRRSGSVVGSGEVRNAARFLEEREEERRVFLQREEELKQRLLQQEVQLLRAQVEAANTAQDRNEERGWEKMTIATFDGSEDAAMWTRQVETSFKARKINNPSQSHILFACSFLRGKTLTWFDAKQRKAEKEYCDAFGSWAEFVSEIRREVAI
jgi:hypothetical protein